MKILDRINPKRSISLLLFYIAMAISIVYFDLFQAIENNQEHCLVNENLELVIDQIHSSSNPEHEKVVDQFIPEKVPDLKWYDTDQFKKRLFHDNRILAHQFKALEKNQPFIDYHSHQQIALIISHQKLEEEGNKAFA